MEHMGFLDKIFDGPWLYIVMATAFVLVVLRLGRKSGWDKFAKRFPSAQKTSEALETLRGQTLSFDLFYRYRAVITLKFYADGVEFSVIPPFSWTHKPFFLPYRDIEGIEKGSTFGFAYHKIISGGFSIYIFRRGGEALARHLASAQPSASGSGLHE